MNAINRGKLEGWPNNLKTHYVDSGSNVDPTYEARHVLSNLIDSTKRTEQTCTDLLKKLKFTNYFRFY